MVLAKVLPPTIISSRSFRRLLLFQKNEPMGNWEMVSGTGRRGKIEFRQMVKFLYSTTLLLTRALFFPPLFFPSYSNSTYVHSFFEKFTNSVDWGENDQNSP